MGTPTKKRTPGQKRQRASHFALKKTLLVNCPKCKKRILPHRACPYCGYYRGRQVIDVNTRVKTKKAPA